VSNYIEQDYQAPSTGDQVRVSIIIIIITWSTVAFFLLDSRQTSAIMDVLDNLAVVVRICTLFTNLHLGAVVSEPV
jgi:hypothetical protein